MNLLVAWLWQGLVVAAVATVAVRMIPGSAAAKRHAIWWLALVAVLLHPWVQTDVPAAVAGPLASVGTIGAAGSAELTLPLPPSWLLNAAAWLWAACVVAGGLRLLFNLFALRALTRTATPLSPEREARFTTWRAARASGRRANIRVSDRIHGACAIGFRRPTILVASALVDALNDDALESIVLHEYAHLERYDEWTRLMQRLVLTIAGLHPAIRWISRAIDIEREIACDQRVVARTRAPLAYARGLTDAAAILVQTKGLMSLAAPGASMHKPMLRARVQRLIERSASPNRFVSWSASVCCGAALLATVVASDRVSGVVAFARTDVAPLTARVPFELAVVDRLPHAFESRLSSALIARPPAPAVTSETERALTPADVQRAPAIEPAVAVSNPTDEPAVPPLASTSWASPLRGPGVPPSSIADQPDADQQGAENLPAPSMSQRLADIGLAAAHAGNATGSTASKAGTSIGRFFRNGGMAIARGVSR
jgi:beta-lactamase regulating signal transducer with metallopeptidase domain